MLRIAHAQVGAGVGSNVFRPDVCLQSVGVIRENRNDLISGLIRFVAVDREVHSEAAGAMVSARRGEIDSEISGLVRLPPIKPGVQRSLLKISVENQIFILRYPGRSYRSHPLQIPPDRLGFVNAIARDEALEVRLDCREGNRVKMGFNRPPDPVSGIIVPLPAQEIDVGNFELCIRMIRHRLLKEDVRAQHSAKSEPGHRPIFRIKIQQARKLRQRVIQPVGSQIGLTRVPMIKRDSGREFSQNYPSLVGASNVPTLFTSDRQVVTVALVARTQLRRVPEVPEAFTRINIFINSSQPVFEARVAWIVS